MASPASSTPTAGEEAQGIQRRERAGQTWIGPGVTQGKDAGQPSMRGRAPGSPQNGSKWAGLEGHAGRRPGFKVR